jgi:hypothetical protein
VTVFFLAGPRRIFDRIVVDLVAMRMCLVRAFSATASGSGTVLVFLVVVDPFGRPRGFGAVTVLAAVVVSGTAFFLGLPARFFTGSVFEASLSSPSLSAGDSGRAATGVTFLPRVVVVDAEDAAAVEAVVAERADGRPRGRAGF